MIHVRISNTALAALHLDDPEVQDTFGVEVNALGRGSNVIRGNVDALLRLLDEIGLQSVSTEHPSTTRTALRIVLRAIEKALVSQ